MIELIGMILVAVASLYVAIGLVLSLNTGRRILADPSAQLNSLRLPIPVGGSEDR